MAKENPQIGTIEYCMKVNRDMSPQKYRDNMKQVISSIAKLDSEYLGKIIALAKEEIVEEVFDRVMYACYSNNCADFGIDPKNPGEFEKAAVIFFLFEHEREKLLGKLNKLEMCVAK